MDVLTLGLSLLTLAFLFWLLRRAMSLAYAAGWRAAQADQDQRERHGLAPLPDERPTS